MLRSSVTAAVVLALTCGQVAGRAQGKAPGPVDFSGWWVLNTELSDHPDQVGLGIRSGGTDNGQPRGGGRGGGGRGGFGGRGGLGGRGGFGGGGRSQESTDDRLRVLELTDEVRNPPSSLSIAQTKDTFT